MLLKSAMCHKGLRQLQRRFDAARRHAWSRANPRLSGEGAGSKSTSQTPDGDWRHWARCCSTVHDTSTETDNGGARAARAGPQLPGLPQTLRACRGWRT